MKYLDRVLYIDLSKKTYWVERRDDLFDKWLGGVGVATALYKEEVPKGIDPMDPKKNVIIFAVGPLTGYYPMASKTVAVFKSPLTGNWGESHAGGRSALAIRLAGYGAIVIRGASNIPIYITITKDKVYFRDARALWGVRSTITVGRIIRENEPGTGMRSIIRIGIAGEKLIRYATAVTETYRNFGRLGLGCVMGAKKLKAIVIIGERIKLPVKNKREYREIYNEIFKMATQTPLMKKYHELGTSLNVIPLNKLGALPVRNLQKTSYKEAEYLSGEYLAKNYLGRRVACSHCPVACVHIAIWREKYEEDPYFYKTNFTAYDYEPIYSTGTLLEIKNPVGMLKIIEKLNRYGLDTISTGVILSWATEASERGLITEKETLIKLEFGNWENYLKAIDYIIEQPNDFYRALAIGLNYAVNKYGGDEFALVFAGSEMPGYHTGPAAHLGFLLGSRHSHLDMAGYSFDQKHIGEEIPPEDTIDALMREEAWRQILSSLVICFFARKIYTPEMVSKALKPLGIEMSEEELEKLGWEIYFNKYALKIREGFDIDKLKLPKRIFETPTPRGKISPEFMQKAIKYFKEGLSPYNCCFVYTPYIFASFGLISSLCLLASSLRQFKQDSISMISQRIS